ncbi:hypothetical protein ACFPRL_27855 [Pseudoclavibacter helvolus]
MQHHSTDCRTQNAFSELPGYRGGLTCQRPPLEARQHANRVITLIGPRSTSGARRGPQWED